MYDISYKYKIIISSIVLILGIVGLFGSNVTIPIFLIVISLLFFVVILTDYIAELKRK